MMTEEQKQTIETMWLAGDKCGVIVRALQGTVTRNMIVGYAHRRHLAPHRVPQPSGPLMVPRQKAGRRKSASAPRIKADDSPRPITLATKASTALSGMTCLGDEYEAIVCEEAEPEEAVLDGVPIWDLLWHHCRWPLGDSTNPYKLRYCGAHRAAGQAYCTEHYGRSVQVRA